MLQRFYRRIIHGVEWNELIANLQFSYTSRFEQQPWSITSFSSESMVRKLSLKICISLPSHEIPCILNTKLHNSTKTSLQFDSNRVSYTLNLSSYATLGTHPVLFRRVFGRCKTPKACVGNAVCCSSC